jgi:hypothetical protein
MVFGKVISDGFQKGCFPCFWERMFPMDKSDRAGLIGYQTSYFRKINKHGNFLF